MCLLSEGQIRFLKEERKRLGNFQKKIPTSSVFLSSFSINTFTISKVDSE